MLYKIILIALWTIFQTLVHFYLMYLGCGLYECTIDPTESFPLTFVYLTYFYRNDCREFHIKDTNNSFLPITNIIGDWEDIYNSEMFHALKDIEDRAQLPEESTNVERTMNYFIAYMVCDILWIFFSLTLIVGAYLKVKRKLSLLFYCPFLVIDMVIIVLDVISSAQFGLDMKKINNYSSWLKFIGVKNYYEFHELDEFASAHLVPVGATIAMLLMSAKFLFFWISNVVTFYNILSEAIVSYEDGLYEGSFRNFNRRKRKTIAERTNNNLDASARIRQWQIFYGTLGSDNSDSNNDNNLQISTLTHSHRIYRDDDLSGEMAQYVNTTMI